MDSRGKLLADYGRVPVLSHEAQLHLARQVRAWLDWDPADGEVPEAVRRRGIRAKQRLVETNLRLVVTVAQKYRRATNRTDDEFQDLIQLGILGLDRGVEKYDPARGYAPSTYFYWWIRQGVSRACNEITNAVRVPENAGQRFRYLSRLIEQWEAQYGHRPSIETLQRLSGLSRVAIENSVVIGRIKFIRSLDQSAKDDSETALGDLLSDPFAQSPDDYCEAEEARRQVQAVLGQLPEADRKILERTYMNGESLKTVAVDMNTSRETIRQRQIKALERAQQIVEIANTLNLQFA